jgi:hypothetical protein
MGAGSLLFGGAVFCFTSVGLGMVLTSILPGIPLSVAGPLICIALAALSRVGYMIAKEDEDRNYRRKSMSYRSVEWDE